MDHTDDLDWRPAIRDTALTNLAHADEHREPDLERNLTRVVFAARVAAKARMEEHLVESLHGIDIRADIDEFLTAMRNHGVNPVDDRDVEEIVRVVASAIGREHRDG